MAIEGPLRELGLHDVFQLLDLSRKTGALRVTSQLRDNEGLVAFDGGAIVFAEIRSNPLRIGELLLRTGRIAESDLERARAAQGREKPPRRLGQILVGMGALSERELVRQVEAQVTEVVFELLSWQEGYFSFAEGPLSVPADATVRIRTETVLMEGARRIDEWSRIEGHIPHLGVIPVLAPRETGNGDMARLDLLPAEWEVLALVDGERDVRAIARHLARSDFDVARTLFGLVTTGILAVREGGEPHRPRTSLGGDAGAMLSAAELRFEAGDVTAAREAALAAAGLLPGEPRVHLLLARVHLKEQRSAEAVEEARRAVRLDPLSLEAHRWCGLALAANGRFLEAVEQFTQWERLVTEGTPPDQREAVATVKAATHLLAQLIGGGHG
jgi:hypothetical protein